MEITISGLSVNGPVRERNEDAMGSILATNVADRRAVGSFAVVADGVAGSGKGGEASKLAVETALKLFREAGPERTSRRMLAEIFSSANMAVYDAGMEERAGGRGATTMTAAIFRGNEVTVGHVGDTRAYVIQGTRIYRLTSDHSYAGLQVKWGFITEEEAMRSPARLRLTRSLGVDPMVNVDYSSTVVGPGDFVLLCSDGIHGSVTEPEMLDAVLRLPPARACQQLVELAEKRGTDDNISVLVAKIGLVEAVGSFRGTAFFTAPQGNESEVGKILDGRFELTSVLSEGGMATVYAGLDCETKERVAIKIPYMRYESDAGAFERFEREEEIGRKLSHPSILRVIPVEKKSRPYIVTEHLEGQTLAELLSQVKQLPVEDAVRISSRLLSALEYMHEHGVVHLDLKPRNIMLCNDGSLRIMDFGISRNSNERASALTKLQPTAGTPDYMAPEQVRGRPGNERTDIYSLGAMLYEMLTGRVPYHGENAFFVMNARLSGDPVAPRTIRADIPPILEEIVLHAMERDDGLRYGSMTAFKSDLDHQHLVRLTGRASRLQAPKIWYSHWRRVRAFVFGVGFILAIFLLIYGLAHSKKSGAAKHSRSAK